MFSTWLHETLLRIKALLMRRRLDRDLEEELAFHLEMREARLREEGPRDAQPAPPGGQEARLAARRQFGNVTRLKEMCREMWTFNFLETLWQDLRYGARMMARNPAFTAIAILTLGIGIGANTAIFSLIDQILLRKLPVPEPGELVVLRVPGIRNGSTHSDGDDAEMMSYPMYKDLRDRNQVFSGLIACYKAALSVAGPGFSERAQGELVTGNYFEVLGVQPALGRVFGPQDETAPGADTAAVLSYSYWQRRFGGSPAVLNQQITVDGSALTVVGVSRQGFNGVQAGILPDIFVPITMKARITPSWDGLMERDFYWLAVIGRLKPGYTAATAQAGLQPLYHSILESELPVMKFPARQEPRFLSRQIELTPGAQGRRVLQRDAGQPLLLLGAMVGMVLLIACTNLAGLLIAKGEARQREIAVRLSIGAGRLRLLRQLVTESLMLACAGGLAGLVIGYVTLVALVNWIPDGIDAAGLHSDLDSHILLFTMATALLTGVLFGFAPAVRLVRSDVQTPLKNQGTTSSSAAGSVRLRKGLLVSQVTLTTVLLAGAGLFTRSLINITHARLGVRTDHLVQFAVAPALNRYSPRQTASFAAQLTRRLVSLPGVRSVSAAEIGVFMNTTSTSQITPEGYRAAEDEKLTVGRNLIGPGYFSTMGIPLIAGREFTESDSLETPKVAIINEKLARRYFNGRDPIGQHLAFQTGNKAHPDIEIVGVVQNSKHDDARDAIRPYVYTPYLQDKTLGHLIFYVRSGQSAAAIYPVLRKTVASIDAGLPVYSMMTLDDQLSESMFADSFVALLSLCLAVIAALLAAIGLYGVMAYVVARRTREIGVRIALGATRGKIVWLVLREAVRMTAIGLTVGLVLSILGGKSAGSLLFGVKATEPAVLLLAALLLSAVAMLAGGLPARRAASVDPVVALRYE